jgi:hypothetical protein
MIVMFRAIWTRLGAALPLVGLLLCAAIAPAQAVDPGQMSSPFDHDDASGPPSMLVPEVYQVEPGSQNAMYFASQPLADEPWPESLPQPYYALPLLDSECAARNPVGPRPDGFDTRSMVG